MEMIRSYLNEYKTLKPGPGLKANSRHFVKYILTSCWPKMHRRVFGWSTITLIKQLSAINHDQIADALRSTSESLSVEPDPDLHNFLVTGKDLYLMRLLDYHPVLNPEGPPSTDLAPIPEALIDATKSITSYTYSPDVAIDFNNILTSSLVAYAIRLDLVDRALHKLKGRVPNDQQLQTLQSLFDSLSVSVRAVFVITHSRVMRKHLRLIFDYLKLPEDQDEGSSMHFITTLMESHCQRSDEVQRFADYLKPSRVRDRSGDSAVNDDDQADDDLSSDDDDNRSLGHVATSEVFRRWIMSLVEHFTSIRLLEHACDKLSESDEIKISLIGVDHWRTKVPAWSSITAMIRDMAPPGSVDGYIEYLETSIRNFQPTSPPPGTMAQIRENVLLPFHNLLKSTPQYINSCQHCEAVLVAVMAYIATANASQPSDSDPKMSRLQELFQARSQVFHYDHQLTKSCS